MRLLRIVLTLALPVALLAACGDDDDGEGAGDDPRTEEQLTADRTLAQQIVLTAEDVGAGWTVLDEVEDEDEDEEEAETGRQLADCLGVDEALFEDGAAQVDSPTFDQETGQIEATVTVAVDEAEAGEYLSIVTSDEFADCYGDTLDRELEADSAAEEDVDITYGGLEVSELALPADLGDEAVGIRSSIALETGGVSVPSYQDLLFVRRGRIVMSFSVLSNFDPLSDEFTQGLARAMDQRAAGA